MLFTRFFDLIQVSKPFTIGLFKSVKSFDGGYENVEISYTEKKSLVNPYAQYGGKFLVHD